MTKVGKMALVATFGAMCVFEQGLGSPKGAHAAAAAAVFPPGPAPAGLPAAAAAAASAMLPVPPPPSFKQPSVFATPCGPFGLASGDIDGVNGPDVVVCCKGRPQAWQPSCTDPRLGIMVFHNSGDWAGDPPIRGFLQVNPGDFYTVDGGDLPVNVALADMDNDAQHLLDMVVSVFDEAGGAHRIAIFYADPGNPGTFLTPPDYYPVNSHPYFVGGTDDAPTEEFFPFAVLDYDLNGTRDVVMPATVGPFPDNAPAMVILAGQSNWDVNPTWLAQSVRPSGDTTVAWSRGLATGTFDAGSTVDLVFNVWREDIYEVNQPVFAVPNSGGGSFGTPVRSESIQSKWMAAAPLDSGAVLDLAVTHWGRGVADHHRVRVVVGNGNLTFGPTFTDTEVDHDPYGIAAGQIAGDIKIDLVTANFHGYSGGGDPQHGNITVLVNTTPAGGMPTFTRHDFMVMPSGSRPKPAQVLLVDFNGDGQLDIVTSNWNSSCVTVLINTTMQTLP